MKFNKGNVKDSRSIPSSSGLTPYIMILLGSIILISAIVFVPWPNIDKTVEATPQEIYNDSLKLKLG